jgi:hypothetical protein
MATRVDVQRNSAGVFIIRHTHELGTDQLIMSEDDTRLLVEILTPLIEED